MPKLYYAIAQDSQLKGLKFTGLATTTGGMQPSVPLYNYPLLAWTHLGHDAHGDDVFTEDGKVGVCALAAALAESPSIDALAERFGTTRDHVVQALDYAVEAGALSA